MLTPQGKVIDLPAGSTPIDFAYALHSDLGHRCRGARVDGHIVKLDTPLASGQRVEIVAAKSGGPSRDWLNPERGFVKSARARHKIRQWFNAKALAETVAAGRAVVEKELRREGRHAGEPRGPCNQARFRQARRAFRRGGARRGQPEAAANRLEERCSGGAGSEESEKAPSAKAAMLVVGMGGLATQLARCCKPVPPDPSAAS